jgi:hypothetical protein
VIEPGFVPRPLLAVPVKYYRMPAPEWKHWHAEAAPRWEPAYGRRWEEHREEHREMRRSRERADRLCWLPRRRVAMSPDRESRFTFLYSLHIRSLHRKRTLNPVAIVIRCHRVIGSNASLTGYAGGLPRKQWLLRHEGALL